MINAVCRRFRANAFRSAQRARSTGRQSPLVSPHGLNARRPPTLSYEEAVQLIRPGNAVYIHGGAATPGKFLDALADRARTDTSLSGVQLHHIHTETGQNYPLFAEDVSSRFCVNSLFTGSNCRAAVNSGMADYTPVFLSDIPLLFRTGNIPLDVAVLQVSPPDEHGFCSLGVSVDCSRAAAEMAPHIIAVVNPNMPRTHGDGIIHLSRIEALVDCDAPIFEMDPKPQSDAIKRIGKYIADELVEDEATLQMGIGAIPDAVLSCLGSHQRLGIHTEMLSDGVIDLIEQGVVDNSCKTKFKGLTVTGFCLGSRRLYDYVDDNPGFAFLDIQYVNSTFTVARNHRMTAINSCIEVDLTGQVVSDSIGSRIYSGVGGQVDFLRGAALSPGGKPILAMPSTTSKGLSRIAPTIHNGAGVTTTRAHVHFIVTEYGIADLWGKSLRERAKALINIAHPSHREELERDAREKLGLRL